MLTVSVDTSGLEQKLLKLAAMTKTSVAAAVRQEARLLAVTLVKYTQPFGFGRDAQKQGQDKIERDYRRVYPVLASQFILDQVGYRARPKDRDAASTRLAAYVQAGNTGAITKMLGDMKIANLAQTADQSYHERRWQRGKLRAGVAQVVVDQKTVLALIDHAKALSGFAKSGWATCAKKLGGTRGGSGGDVQAWVTRLNAPGQVIDKSSSDNPSVTIINGVNYTSAVINKSSQRQAIRDREYALETRINAALKHGAKNI